MCYTSGDVKKAVDSFKRNVGEAETECPDCVRCKIVIGHAFDNAYGDVKRTLTGIGAFHNEKENAKDSIVKKISEYFFDFAPCEQEAFDKLHNDLCMLWCEQFKGNDLGTYGKAQKIINMTFKYLFCCKSAERNRAYFKYCHMPLDSFTLEWIKRNVKDGNSKLCVGKVAPWSKLQCSDGKYFTGTDNKEYYAYGCYVRWIRDYIQDKNLEIFPLELEFIVWPEMRKKLAAEGFLIGLLDSPSTREKQEIREKSLDENYEEIQAVLSGSDSSVG